MDNLFTDLNGFKEKQNIKNKTKQQNVSMNYRSDCAREHTHCTTDFSKTFTYVCIFMVQSRMHLLTMLEENKTF